MLSMLRHSYTATHSFIQSLCTLIRCTHVLEDWIRNNNTNTRPEPTTNYSQTNVRYMGNQNVRLRPDHKTKCFTKTILPKSTNLCISYLTIWDTLVNPYKTHLNILLGSNLHSK
uniref:Uncharacterized protein n=1 Tax=Cacopsylla melanoneura TaxID=428564 RepID=A0A8D8W8E1_9HEMI